MGAGLYHQVAGLGSGFLQRELRVATVVSKPRFLGKKIAQCDAVIQPQIFSQNLSAVQLDFAAPNLQLEQGGAVILRIKYQCTAVPHGHSHRAVAAAAVNDRQITGESLTRGRRAAHIQAVPIQAMSVQVQREGLAGIYAVRQPPVCQQGDGAAICGLVKDLSQRIIGAVLSGGLHVQLVRCDTHAIGTLHPHRKRRAAASTLIIAGILVMGARRVADVADAVREAIVWAYEAAVAGVDVGLERIRVGILRTLWAMRVRHNDDILGQILHIAVDEFSWFIFLRKSKPLAQQPQHIAVSIYRSLYRNAVCTVACDNRAFLQATHQLAPVLDEQAAGKGCLAFEFQRTSVLALLIVIYEDSRHRRLCRLGNRCIIADDQLAALYMQRRSALKGQALPIHHERNGFFDRLPLCITAEADRVIIVQRCQHRHCVAVLRRVQRRREGSVCAAVRAVRSCDRSSLNGSLVDRELHHIGNIFIVVSGLAGLGVDVVGVIAFLVETADCGVFIDCRNDITLVLRIANYCLVLRIVICHRSIFLHTADEQ